MSSPLALKALELAHSYVGRHEQPRGSNRSPFIDAINTAVDAPIGSPWCASFVYHCFAQAALSLGVPNPLLRSGYTPAIYNWAKRRGKLVTDPQPGDVFLLRGGTHGHFHTGMVARVPDANRVETVEGNSNLDGSADGFEVVERKPGRRLETCDFYRLP